jgi:hypothetical protein
MKTVDDFIKDNEEFFILPLKYKEKSSSRSVVSFFDLGEGIVHEVPNYEHIKWLSARFEWVARELEELEESISRYQQDFEDSIEPEEHPGWHVFEIYSGNERTEKYWDIFQEVAQKHSMIRVGFYKSTMDLSPMKEKTLNEEQLKFFKDLASMLGFKLHFQK